MLFAQANQESSSNGELHLESKEEKLERKGLFSELKFCNEKEQHQKINEMSHLVDAMEEEQFWSSFTVKLFDKLYKMITEKKLLLENAVLLLKRTGYCKKLKGIYSNNFYFSSLSGGLETMICDEENKKEDKNYHLLIDLCECYFLNRNVDDYHGIDKNLLYVCVPCFLKEALKKEEDEEARMEVEMALLALSNIGQLEFIEKELYLNEIMDIIKYHQKHRNLTHLAYQSAWEFLIDRLSHEEELKKEITDSLHFEREVVNELEELRKEMEQKNKEKDEKEMKAEWVIRKWCYMLEKCFVCIEVKSEEIAKLIACVVRMCRTARECNEEVHKNSMLLMESMNRKKVASVDDFLEGGADEFVLEEVTQPSLKDIPVCHCLMFISMLLSRLNENSGIEKTDTGALLTKRKMFAKLEEEGYEDIVYCIHRILRRWYKNFLISRHERYLLRYKFKPLQK